MRRRRDSGARAPMVYVPAGRFLMGAADDEARIDAYVPEIDELAPSRPQREVFVSSFWIDVYPVTCAQYKRFVDATGHPVPSLRPRTGLPMLYAWDPQTRRIPPGLDEYPVVCVSWYDALAYCQWAGKRLPSEAEWEKAARGTDGRPFPWGDDPHWLGRANVCGLGASAVGPDGVDLAPVDAFPSGVSPFGCYDTLGNAAEWCADWYSETYYQRAPLRDPRGPASPIGGARRVDRGLCRYDGAPHVAKREWCQPWYATAGIGFRCAASASRTR